MAKKTTVKKQRPAGIRRESSADTRERASLMTALREHVQKRTGTQAEKAEVLGITQPRLNDLLKGRVDKFSLDALVALAPKAGLRVNVNVQPVQILPRPSSINRRLTTVPSTFAPHPNELGQLDSKQGPSLFLRLLRCEAIANGLSPKDVVLSSNSNAPDGGIDAKVDNSPKSNALLAKGSTYYQIKTGSGFKPWQLSALKKELFDKSRKRLGNAVKTCLEQNGTYALVTLGHDLLPHQHTDAVTHLTNLFQACGYAEPKVEVYGQGQIAGELEKYPSLCLALVGLDDGGFQSIEDWKDNPQMQLALQLGSEQEKFIKEIRTALHENAVQHIRVIGEPGIGKTRLVYESVSDDSIAPSVVYVPNGEAFQKSQLFKELLKSDRYSVTLVIDDCDNRDRASIWSALKGRSGIKLITIDHGPDETYDSAMRTYHCPPLADEQIKNILFGYLQQNADLHNWAGWCSGSPRVAHLVGENLRSNPDHVLKSPADVPIWDRFIIGHKEMDSEEAKQHRLVLRHIAIFQRFGFESPVSDEGEFICDLVKEADQTMTWRGFQEIVQHYRSKRILQGSHTLFIVPKALHVYLWVDFWKNYGRGFPFQAFMERIPTRMKRWFLQLFIYAHGASPAQTVVKDILSPTGPFSDHDFLLSEPGLRFLNYLSEADPAGTLALLERTIKTWSHEQLYAWHTGRQDIVWALEKIVAQDEYFTRAVNVLIPMALAENAGYSNNSKGLLLSLFNVGLGWTTATEAEPSKRLPILKELVMSNDASRRALGLEMCQQWLKTEDNPRTVGAEYQGLKPPIEFWRPKTYGEVFEYWRQVLRFLRVAMKGFNAIDRNRVAEVFVTAAHDFVHFMRIEEMAGEVMDILFELTEDKEINRKALIQFVILALWRNSDDSDKTNTILGRVRQLDKVLTGTSLWERTERYVLYSTWQEDYVFHGGERKESKLPGKRVRHLAGEYMRDFTAFSEHLPKLVRASGGRLPELGMECGKLAKSKFDEELLKHIESGNTDINGFFVSGYFGGLRTRDEKRWETLLHRLLHNQMTRKIAIDCMGSFGFTESLLRDMLILLKEGKIDSTAFGGFVFKQDKDTISDHLFQEIIATLLRRPDQTSVNVCRWFVYNYYFAQGSSDDFPEALVFEVLTMLSETDDLMSMYYWNEIAKGFIKKHPTRSVDLLNEMLRNMRRISHHGASGYIAEVADEIVIKHPLEAWKIISEILISETKNRHVVVRWLADTGLEDMPKQSPVNYLPAEEVLRWIKEDPEHRQGLILAILPRTLDQATGGSLPRLFIEEFCDDDRVASSLFWHFHIVSGWTGPESDYLSRKRDAARQWLSEILSVKIQSWLGKYIDYLNSLIEDAKIREEREF